MSSHITPLLERNRAFAATETRKQTPRRPFLPDQGLYIITCMDSRTDPADFLGLRFGEAIVARTVGGRVTPAVIQGLSFIGYLVESKSPEGPYFEAAIIHHTDCGSAWLASDKELRQGFARRTGYDEDALADLAVVDPAATVRADVERVLSDPRISRHITVSGHVYDVDTGLITTVVEPASPSAPAAASPR
jgi:carbonic anhydrase